jgi:hypothetical protein
MKSNRSAVWLAASCAVALAGCSHEQAVTLPSMSGSAMPVFLAADESDWVITTTMKGAASRDTALVTLSKPGDSQTLLVLRVTDNSTLLVSDRTGQRKPRVIAEVRITNQDLVDDIHAAMDAATPGFWQLPLYVPNWPHGRWLEFKRHDHRRIIARSLYATFSHHGLALNEAIGLNLEHLPNGPFDRHNLVLWFIQPEEIPEY